MNRKCTKVGGGLRDGFIAQWQGLFRLVKLGLVQESQLGEVCPKSLWLMMMKCGWRNGVLEEKIPMCAMKGLMLFSDKIIYWSMMTKSCLRNYWLEMKIDVLTMLKISINFHNLSKCLPIKMHLCVMLKAVKKYFLMFLN